MYNTIAFDGWNDLDIVNVDLAVVVAELECAFAVFFAEGVGFVDFGVFGEFAVGFDCGCEVESAWVQSKRQWSEMESGVNEIKNATYGYEPRRLCI